ncbi:putative ATP-grasp-modified RiPP [Streptomyces sp. JJ66]|uniref:putative ATP-grasp-modified RiPP n=1 Tax=Streptomyces sp. JJ66 TaxID=2803843 RepID=UPI001C58EED7|nr:putative ATP-grasp-modified RiPP [Streptomyces sp. JJ66]MBW1601631.1 putative ATP-grasp-modified RiPP [Streptomyces sp. JJ66]
METELLTPLLYPHSSPPATQQGDGGPAVPFGITQALPFVPETVGVREELYLCPERQISVTAEGKPFISEPSMGSQVQTVTQTQEDMQLFTDNHGTDTD